MEYDDYGDDYEDDYDDERLQDQLMKNKKVQMVHISKKQKKVIFGLKPWILL